MDVSKARRLNNGVWMPQVGLGVYQVPPGQTAQESVLSALTLGYRHIDTAAVYRNERDVGAALKASGLPRREFFVTTKLASGDHGFDAALAAFDRSMEFLGLEKVDLYLIHWPGSPRRRSSWRALERIYKEGRARAIGVSNYTRAHLEELLAHCEVPPAVNQVEFSPYLFQQDLLQFCTTHDIQLEAYSPLTQGQKLDAPELTHIAAKYDRTPAQTLLRWGIEHGLVVIPKSTHRERQKENLEIFDFQLSAEDFEAMNQWNQNLRTCWDPTKL